MILYIAKVLICQSLLMLSYRVLLHNERMNRFKRVYLLSAIALSFLVPFVDSPMPAMPQAKALIDMRIEPVYTSVADEMEIVPLSVPQAMVAHAEITPVATVDEASEVSLTHILIAVYALVTCTLLVRLVRDVSKMMRLIRRSPQIKRGGYTIVLLENKSEICSFLHYVMLPKDDYLNRKISGDILAHEVAHVRQRHSCDVLIVELLLCLLWFDLPLYFYKAYMKMNHEYLADEAVAKASDDLSQYQYRLINIAGSKSDMRLSSGFSYKTTKQRLIMMTKNTTRKKILLKQTLVSALTISAVLVLGNTPTQASSEERTVYYVDQLAKIEGHDNLIDTNDVDVSKLWDAVRQLTPELAGSSDDKLDGKSKMLKVDTSGIHNRNFVILTADSIRVSNDMMYLNNATVEFRHSPVPKGDSIQYTVSTMSADELIMNTKKMGVEDMPHLGLVKPETLSAKERTLTIHKSEQEKDRSFDIDPRAISSIGGAPRKLQDLSLDFVKKWDESSAYTVWIDDEIVKDFKTADYDWSELKNNWFIEVYSFSTYNHSIKSHVYLATPDYLTRRTNEGHFNYQFDADDKSVASRYAYNRSRYFVSGAMSGNTVRGYPIKVAGIYSEKDLKEWEGNQYTIWIDDEKVGDFNVANYSWDQLKEYHVMMQQKLNIKGDDRTGIYLVTPDYLNKRIKEKHKNYLRYGKKD